MAASELTQQELQAFFTEARQMAIPLATVNGGLMQEGITTVEDLEEFNDDDLKAVRDNLKKPSGTVPDPNDNNLRIPAPAYVIGAKSFKRIKIAAAAVRYYTTIGRTLTATNMRFIPVLKNFGEQWEAIVEKSSDDAPDIPKITRALPIVKWTESFEDFLHQAIGSRYIALSYLIRDNVVPEDPPPPLLEGKCYSESHKSVMGELIARANHDHTKYQDDNEKLYSYLEEATRTTQYASSIRPFSRRKDGREAYLALKRQYAGKDKWQAEIKKQENFIHTRVWKGNTNFSLESFITQHCAAHVSLERCSQSVPHQLPNERTRVIYLMDPIQCSDAAMQAAIAHIKSQSEDPNGLGASFEDAAAYLLQFCPVSKKRKSSSVDHNASCVHMENSNSNNNNSQGKEKKLKVNKGKTGVELRYYKPQEYRKLSEAQIEELRKWRTDNGLTRAQKKKGKDKVRDEVVAALKQIAKGDEKKKGDEESLRKYIISVVNEESTDNKIAPDKSGDGKHVQFTKDTLNAIMKRLS